MLPTSLQLNHKRVGSQEPWGVGVGCAVWGTEAGKANLCGVGKKGHNHNAAVSEQLQNVQQLGVGVVRRHVPTSTTQVGNVQGVKPQNRWQCIGKGPQPQPAGMLSGLASGRAITVHRQVRPINQSQGAFTQGKGTKGYVRKV